MGRLGYSCSAVGECATKAFYSCPAIISCRPGSQNTPKKTTSRLKNEPNQTSPLTSRPTQASA
ncbi:MAG: hypothetical protein ACK53Y_19130 [bacterium]